MVRKTSAERGYGAQWQAERDAYLLENPLCVRCKRADNIVRATVVDHIIPHKGDPLLFWDRKNWQSLCTPHHSSDKQIEERGGVPRSEFDSNGRVIW